MITSRTNSTIKALAALQRRKDRLAQQRTLAEGIHLVRDALRSKINIIQLVISESGLAHAETPPLLNDAAERGIELLEINDACYDKLTALQSPEGIAAVLPIAELDASLLLTDPRARLLVAAGVQDPGNAGALARTAEAAGASGCIFLDGIDPWSPKFLRGTMGSAFRVPCASMSEPAFLAALPEQNLRLLCLAAGRSATFSYDNADYAPPVALCVGGEGAGVSAALLSRAAQTLAIPMSGAIESLNAAVAAGIVLYRARAAWQE